jgi:hypothetical protein
VADVKKFTASIEARAKRDPKFREELIKELKKKEREELKHVVAIAKEIKRLEAM